MVQKMVYPVNNLNNWIIIPRLLVGLLIADQGLGLFNKGHMDGNIAWLTDVNFPIPAIMAHVGKATELVGGILLMIGLLVRLASVALVINMAVITFVMGNGKIFSDDQLPFLFLLVFLCFVFTGGGKWSVDRFVFSKNQTN